MFIPAPAEQRRDQHEHNTWHFVAASGELGLETVRAYTKPTEEDKAKAKALNLLPVDR